MEKLFLSALLVLGSVGTLQAQETVPAAKNDEGNVALNFAAVPAAQPALVKIFAAPDTFFSPPAKPADALEAPVAATALAVPLAPSEPAVPSPKPNFVYGSRDDYRWQLGLAVTWVRFRSSIFNASAVGINTSVSYFTNEWFAIEGNVAAAFAPQIFDREHVKILIYGAGPKIAWRQKKWEPWLHALAGGAHEQPQTAGNSRNAFSLQAGGGADYRWTHSISFRLEGDYVHTGFFNQSQNNFQLAGGIVFHF
jgi:outer membrane protein with beta-barrel domain